MNILNGVALMTSGVAGDSVCGSLGYSPLMHAVINHLYFAAPVETHILTAMQTDVTPKMSAVEGFKGLMVIQVAEDHVVLIITGTGPDVLDHLATEVGSPWMRANIVPLLSRPPERVVGAVVIGTGIAALN